MSLTVQNGSLSSSCPAGCLLDQLAPPCYFRPDSACLGRLSMNPEASWALPLHAHDSLWLPSSFRFFFLHWIINSVRETLYLSYPWAHPQSHLVNPPWQLLNELRERHWRHLSLFTCRWSVSPETKEDSVPFCRLFPSLPYTQLLETWLCFTLGTLREDQWPFHRGASLAACLGNLLSLSSKCR